jgi:hypothetical protein
MTSPNGNEGSGSLLGQVHTAVIRLDAKVDNVQTEMRYMRDEHRDGHTDHEARIRKIESSYAPVDRLAKLEERPYVSPLTVWKLLGALTAIAGVVIAFVNTMK